MGDMADLLMYDDPFDFEEIAPIYITCNRCGEDGLHWECDCDCGEYRLYDEYGDRHVCEPSTEGFTKL
jgi:hypothetical protein